MMTDDEIIAVVQAHKDGKQIQWNYNGIWTDMNPEDTFKYFNWRVKPDPPKPREWTVVEYQGEIYSRYDGVFPNYIRVREVI